MVCFNNKIKFFTEESNLNTVGLNEGGLNHIKFSYCCLVDVQTLTAHSLIIDQNLQFIHTVSVKSFPVNFELSL